LVPILNRSAPNKEAPIFSAAGMAMIKIRLSNRSCLLFLF
jgi:hypothetical protein